MEHNIEQMIFRFSTIKRYTYYNAQASSMENIYKSEPILFYFDFVSNDLPSSNDSIPTLYSSRLY